MATNTPGDLAGHIENFRTYVAAANWDSAEDELLQAEAVLQTLPATDVATFSGSLERCWKMLESRRLRAGSWKKVLWRRNR